MKTNKRGLSEKFIIDLKKGYLKPIIEMLKIDHTLCLQIRNDYINIYYRGGCIIEIKKTSSSYTAYFNNQYFKIKDKNKEKFIKSTLQKNLSSEIEVKKWVENMPILKQVMDEFYSNSSKNEREFQQLVARENNNSIISNDTDYYITDIEYTQPQSKGSRFDLIGIKWASSSNERKKTNNCRIVIIEMKYGDGALKGSSGIKKHLKDIEIFCSSVDKLSILKSEIITSFKQLRELGLIKFGKGDNKHQIEKLSSEKPEFILLFSNHKPSNKQLEKEFSEITELANVDVKIATSSFMGYGLYQNNMLTIDEFKARNFSKQF